MHKDSCHYSREKMQSRSTEVSQSTQEDLAVYQRLALHVPCQLPSRWQEVSVQASNNQEEQMWSLSTNSDGAKQEMQKDHGQDVPCLLLALLRQNQGKMRPQGSCPQQETMQKAIHMPETKKTHGSLCEECPSFPFGHLYQEGSQMYSS
jgi:hypothetical protein